MPVAALPSVKLLRSWVGDVPYTDVELQRVLEHVGDMDLTAAALLMRPRPHWVHSVATNRETR